MNKRKIFLLIFGLMILVQLIVFKFYIFPIRSGYIKVKGLACTCPDEKVIEGIEYLKKILQTV